MAQKILEGEGEDDDEEKDVNVPVDGSQVRRPIVSKVNACVRSASSWGVCWPEKVSLAEAPAPHPVGR